MQDREIQHYHIQGYSAFFEKALPSIKSTLDKKPGDKEGHFATGRLDTDATKPSIGGAEWALSFLLKKLEPTFSESLMELIEKKGCTPAEIYTKAGVTKSHFAKIKADKDYPPSKETELTFAVVLHLDLKETAELRLHPLPQQRERPHRGVFHHQGNLQR